MLNDDPEIGGKPISEWEMWFQVWDVADDDPHQECRGFMLNESSVIPHEWQLTSRWQPRGLHEDGPFTDEQRAIWETHQPQDDPEPGEGGDAPDTGTKRDTGHYMAVTGTFGVHPASKWGTEV